MDHPAPAPDANFWKRKLAAFLHDPPEKAFDLAWHRERAEAHQSGLALEDTVFTHEADHTAAAADRLPWPTYRHLECRFDGRDNHFKHPLGRSSLKISPFASADIATDKAWRSRPQLAGDPTSPDFDHRAQFLAYWRLWRWWASDQRHPRDPRLAFLPADTRLPDHTIWAHNSLVSALQGCVEDDGVCRPSFLLFQLGPVQDYIAAARRTLDLWSGSYLLSYLIGSGLRHLALTSGPDHVIFPNLCGQPIFDLLLQEEVWSKASVVSDEANSGAATLWDSLGYRDGYPRKRLLTPSLPNRFLAILPANRATEIAKEVAAVIRQTHDEIAAEVWKLASRKLASRVDEQRTRFSVQSSRFLDLSWQTLDWPKLPQDALQLTARIPKPKDGDHQASLRAILDLATNMPKDHRDVRNFKCACFPQGTRSASGRDISGWKDKSKLQLDAPLDNPGAAWSALYALLNWQLDAVRQTRAWHAWESADRQAALDNNKDSLNGREEAVLNLATGIIADGDVERLNNAFEVPHLFKKGELLGASTLIKRLWPTAWLQPKHGFSKGDFSVPDTRDIAAGEPYNMSGDSTNAPDDEKRYFAVLAFDGDEIGKWVNGTHPNMPKLGDQLADYTDGGERMGAGIYFEKQPHLLPLLKIPRPLNPSFHLQLSEMLGNFSNICARRIVEAFNGYLFYSGGDDVVAMLPAQHAVACARALRAAFQGTKELNKVRGAWMVSARKRFDEKDDRLRLFDVTQEGFIQLHRDNYFAMEGEPKNFPAIVPGPATDCSVGIAMAHFKTPLQDVVRAAQIAERRAKNELGRSAVAVTLFKRSGEILEWGCRWGDGGLALFEALLDAMRAGQLSGKFPHRLAELIEPFISQPNASIGQLAHPIQDAEGFATAEIIRREFARCLGQHEIKQNVPDKERLRARLDAYLGSLSVKSPSKIIESITGLLAAIAFAHRTAEKPVSDPTPKGN
jgi:CRISPR-associated protein Cmr2